MVQCFSSLLKVHKRTHEGILVILTGLTAGHEINLIYFAYALDGKFFTAMEKFFCDIRLNSFLFDLGNLVASFNPVTYLKIVFKWVKCAIHYTFYPEIFTMLFVKLC